ncbi:MAG TPA: hypothetical protein VN661_13230 [Candidatus Acidoferrales bacterium]|nr:hypothetical protein [Candidatus Acidoferrales bacterium]
MRDLRASQRKFARIAPWAVLILLAFAIPGAALARDASSSAAAAQESAKSQAQPNSQDKKDKQDKQDKQSKDKGDAPAMTKIRIQVTGSDDKPVQNASVYIGFYESGGLFHGDKMAELDLKTSQSGTVKVPEIPRGRIRIQVLAKGWHTFGKWYDIEKPEELVEIKLVPPPHWY